MFGFLKDKLKKAVESFSRNAEVLEEEIPNIPSPEELPEPPKVEETPEELEDEDAISPAEEGFEKGYEKEAEEPEKPIEEIVREVEEEVVEAPKKGFFGRMVEKISSKTLSEDKFEELFEELEIALLENNVALEVVDKIKEDLKKKIVDVPLKGNLENLVKESLKKSLEEVFNVPSFDVIERIKSKKPFIIMFVGVNGVGKTTGIAKFVKLLQDNKLSCVISASDTFRSAAQEQLQEWGNMLNVKVITHDYGSDPAAVAYDAVEYAKNKNIDCVLIDTAGRMHSNSNLMQEMEKIMRVAKPDLKLFIGESIAGNDVVIQSKSFDESIGIDAIILSKSDIDEKGGAAISIGYVIKKPILYLGVGQEYKDLEKFDSAKILKDLGF